MKNVPTALILAALIPLAGCQNVRGVKLGPVTLGDMSGANTSSSAQPKRSGLTINNSTDPSCDGIVVTDAGVTLFRKQVPISYVDIANNGSQRKSVTVDVLFRRQGRDVVAGSYDEKSWKEAGPFVLRPGQDARFPLSTKQLQGISITQVNVVRCL